MNPQGMVQTNPVNKTQGHSVHSYSTFDKSLSYRKAMLLRFGDYTPSFEMEGVPTDNIELNSRDMIDSLSLNAPFKGQIRKIKESFAVPYSAILPRNWDRIYTQPSNGDDVPTDANCVISGFESRFYSIWLNGFFNHATDNEGNTTSFINDIVHTLILGEFVYSKGSLLNYCGAKLSGRFSYKYSVQADNILSARLLSYDAWFDIVLFELFKDVTYIVVNVPISSTDSATRVFQGLNGSYTEFPVGTSVPNFVESFRAFLELMRENPASSVVDVYLNPDGTGIDWDAVTPLFNVDEIVHVEPELVQADMDDPTLLNSHNLNLSRILAYQLVCAHYFTNSSLDFVYTAELYRQYIHSLCPISGNMTDSFSWNGFNSEYDILSGHLLTYFLLPEGLILEGSYDVPTFWSLWSAIFGFRKSLRFGDYFVGSRPRPLAPINTDVSVNNNKVDVVDVTRNIQAQRFANFVMRTRSKIEDYVKGMFGKAPTPDYSNPFYLTRQEEMIFGDDVQNTAESQSTNPNSRTANFASGMNAYTFTFHNDDAHPCVYLQIISFDVKRFYTRTVERFFMHADRFDMFNPNYQYIGDQPVYGAELGYYKNDNGTLVIPETFAYQTRDAEYKERFDVACGDWDTLPGWILTDKDRSRMLVPNIDSDFIRSYNTELDQFYLSLTGYALGTYYHFICITNNLVNAKRPMAVDPQILA